MTKRRLGKSDIEITPIGLGTWQFSKARGFIGGFWKSLDTETTRSIVGAALEGGINWFDTAEAMNFTLSKVELESIDEASRKVQAFR